MLKQYEVLPLFSTPVYSSILNSVDENTINAINNLKFSRTEFDTSWKTETNKALTEFRGLRELGNDITREFTHYITNVLEFDTEKLTFIMTNSWANKFDFDDYQQPRNFSNAIFAGQLFIDVDDSCGPLRFHKNAWGDTWSTSFSLKRKSINTLNGEFLDIQPKKNQLLFYPAHLIHSRNLHKSPVASGLTVSFTFYMRGQIGEGEEHVAV